MLANRGGRSTTTARLVAGDRVGSFTIEAILRDGAVTTLYRGCHDILSSSAAVKVLHPDLVGRWATRERMLQEARLLHTLRHPTMVEIYDAGVLDDGRTWVASELVQGETVAEYVTRAGTMPPRDVAAVVRSIADALELVGAHDVVRGDLEPDQIVITSGNGDLGVKVMDWGVAFEARGRAADEGSDVRALGVVAYELAVGREFPGRDDPLDPAVCELAAAAPGLESLVAAMTAMDPRVRPTLAEVRTRLDDLGERLEITEVVPPWLDTCDDIAAFPVVEDLDVEEPADVALHALDDAEADHASSTPSAPRVTMRMHGIPRPSPWCRR